MPQLTAPLLICRAFPYARRMAETAAASPARIYLVDGSGYIFRAFYAVAPLSTRDGFPTNALFGFTRMLMKLLSQAGDAPVAMVFDAGRTTFRNDLYPEYKANRSECPAELVPQMPVFREIAAALGLPILELPGFEADDVIGTLTHRLAPIGAEVVIVSADKDLMQLVDERVWIWDTMRDRSFRVAEVREKFGVSPEQVVEVLGLTGDDSDNVPGVPGVGPKTAAQLIERFGSVEGVLANLEALQADSAIRNRKKIAAAIESNVELLRLSRRLVEVAREAPLMMVPEGRLGEEGRPIETLSPDELLHALRRREPEPSEIRALFDRLEFHSLLKEFPLALEASRKEAPKATYHVVYLDQFAEFVAKLTEQPRFAFDVETTSLDTLTAELVGASFCWSKDEAWYVPLAHTTAAKPQVPVERFIEALRPLFEREGVAKVAQNMKYDIAVLARYGIEFAGAGFDTMVASYLLNSEKGSHNLGVLALEFLGQPMADYEEVVAGCESFCDVEIQAAAEYCCRDSHYTWLIAEALEPQLAEQELERVFREVEMPLVPVLARMERRGVLLDMSLFATLSGDLAQQIATLEQEIYELAGTTFNLNSPKQLAEVLFTKLGISSRGLKRTKTGVSTDSSVLEKLRDRHPLPGKLLQYRMLHKLKSTYVDALPAQVSPTTGRLHTKLNQTVTTTGRLSSSEPNLQNIPIQTPEGRKIRRGFIAPPGKVLISADYSQIELRVLAHMSGDPALIHAFSEDIDIHAATARDILGLAPDAEVNAAQRRAGKTINFGIVYGMGPYRLSQDLGIPFEEATRYIESYFHKYQQVRELFDRIEHDAQTKGYVTTMLGRRRPIALGEGGGRDKGFLLRAAINAPIQGTAADIIKLAMITLERRVSAERAPLSMLLQIHDELLFECTAEAAPEMRELLREEMEQVIALAVPLRVEVGHGANWEEAHA